MAGLQAADTDVLAGAAQAHVEPLDVDEKHHRLEEESDLHQSVHDGIHDGLILATDEDLHTLRRIPDKIPWNAYRASRAAAPILSHVHTTAVIALVEMAERFSVRSSHPPCMTIE